MSSFDETLKRAFKAMRGERTEESDHDSESDCGCGCEHAKDSDSEPEEKPKTKKESKADKKEEKSINKKEEYERKLKEEEEKHEINIETLKILHENAPTTTKDTINRREPKITAKYLQMCSVILHYATLWNLDTDEILKTIKQTNEPNNVGATKKNKEPKKWVKITLLFSLTKTHEFQVCGFTLSKGKIIFYSKDGVSRGLGDKQQIIYLMLPDMCNYEFPKEFPPIPPFQELPNFHKLLSDRKSELSKVVRYCWTDIFTRPFAHKELLRKLLNPFEVSLLRAWIVQHTPDELLEYYGLIRVWNYNDSIHVIRTGKDFVDNVMRRSVGLLMPEDNNSGSNRSKIGLLIPSLSEISVKPCLEGTTYEFMGTRMSKDKPKTEEELTTLVRKFLTLKKKGIIFFGYPNKFESRASAVMTYRLLCDIVRVREPYYQAISKAVCKRVICPDTGCVQAAAAYVQYLPRNDGWKKEEKKPIRLSHTPEETSWRVLTDNGTKIPTENNDIQTLTTLAETMGIITPSNRKFRPATLHKVIGYFFDLYFLERTLVVGVPNLGAPFVPKTTIKA